MKCSSLKIYSGSETKTLFTRRSKGPHWPYDAESSVAAHGGRLPCLLPVLGLSIGPHSCTATVTVLGRLSTQLIHKQILSN
jgi:hypothetical protein